MNKGIKMATGDIIGISNSDDWLELDAVENIVKNYSPQKPQILYGFLNMWKCDGTLHKTIFINHECLKEENIPHPACFVSRSVYDEIGLYGYVYKLISDYDFMLRAYLSGYVTFVPVKEQIANFTEGGASGSINCDIEIAKLQKAYGFISKRTYFLRIIKLKVKKMVWHYKS